MGTNWQSLYIFVSMDGYTQPKFYVDKYRQALVGVEAKWMPAWTGILEKMQLAKEWVFLGTGKSGYIARKLAATARSLGKKAVFILPSEGFHGDLGQFSADSLAIFISKSGSSEEHIQLAEWLLARGIPAVGLLGNRQGKLTERLPLFLDCSVAVEADTLDLAPSCSTMLALIAGESLMFSWADANGFTYADFSGYHPGGQLGKNWNLRVEQVMNPLDSIARLTPTHTMRQVLIAMTEKPLGIACIEENGKLVGIITEGDVRRALVKGLSLENSSASEIMNAAPKTCGPDSLLGTAIQIMESDQQKRSALPVVDHSNRLLGVIRIHDAY